MIWQHCLGQLQDELSAQQFNTWIRPLQLVQESASQQVRLVAPNRFVLGWVEDKFLPRIEELCVQFNGQLPTLEVATRITQSVGVESAAAEEANTQLLNTQPLIAQPLNKSTQEIPAQLGTSISNPKFSGTLSSDIRHSDTIPSELSTVSQSGSSGICSDSSMALPSNTESHDSVRDYPTTVVNKFNQRNLKNSAARPFSNDIDKFGLVDIHEDYLNEKFCFDNFVEGKSNQLARAAAQQVSENPAGSYNPLFIYGGVGLGKTHLMHAVGNALRVRKPNAKIVYLHSERFVADMVKALQLNAINDFKRFYRSVDALLIDDIQFFARKERSQEEFFHTFNALLEGGHQMILTCDRYPKEIVGVEERLKSRFGWGLTVAVEPPELETRVAILIKKAQQANVDLPDESAFFIAQRVSSNIRELEGALKRVIAGAHFTGRPIDIELIRESLKDLLALQDKLVTIDNIQRIAAEYYKIKMSDMLSKRRSRSVARPRQVAMALAKEMTDHSLPEIGEAFGGRDHTTVLHACRKIKELQDTSGEMREDIKLLTRALKT